jgi:hypothetical protein
MSQKLTISSASYANKLTLVKSINIQEKEQLKKRKVPQPSTYKSSTVLIPENLELLTLLAENPPFVKQCNNNIYIQAEKCAVILDLILNATIKAEQVNRISKKGFANISSYILQYHVQDYNEYIEFLIESDVLEADNHYLIGEKSKGYRFTEKYINSPLKKYPILDHGGKAKLGAAVFKNLSKPTIDEREAITNYPDLYQDLLSVTVTDLDVAEEYIYNGLYSNALSSVLDTFKARRNGNFTIYKKHTNIEKHKFIHPYIVKKQNAWYKTLHDLNKKHVYFKQDSTSNRLHTSLLRIKSECRQFLKLQGKDIISCDIKNSQPYISAFFFTPGKVDSSLKKVINKCFSKIEEQDKSLYKDIWKRITSYKKGNILPSTQRYIDLVQSGEIYEFIAINIGILHGIRRKKPIYYDRNHGKNAVFKLFFNPNKYSTLVRDIFKYYFPQVAALFEDINSIFTHTRKESERRDLQRSNNILAITLQSIESYLILDVICKNMKEKYPDIPLLTIHDAVATNPEFKEVLLEEMFTALSTHVGIKPSIKVEDWSVPIE